MRTHLFLAFTIAVASASTLFAQTATQPPMISVSGSAEVKVAPDEILLSVGVETRDERLETAKQDNDARISKALAFLKACDLKSKDIQTDFVSVEPSYDGKSSWTKPVTYIVRKSVEIKLTRIDSFEPILTGLLTNGVNNVHGVEFRTSQLRKHRDAARAMAIQAAKEKAVALASELGVKCGKVQRINANEWGGSWNSSASWGGGRYNTWMAQNRVQNTGSTPEIGDGGLSIGQIGVSASVDVSFLIE
jgi:hypothetical protein